MTIRITMQTTTTYTLDPVRDLTESGTAYELRFHFDAWATSPDTSTSSSVTVTIPSFYVGKYDLDEYRDVAQIISLLENNGVSRDATDNDTRLMLTKAIDRLRKKEEDCE